MNTVLLYLLAAMAGSTAGRALAFVTVCPASPKPVRDDDLICKLKREAKQRGEGIVG